MYSPADRGRLSSPSAAPDFLKKSLALMTDTLRMASDRGIPADAAINDMLEAVGGFLGVSRAYVMLDKKDETRPSGTRRPAATGSVMASTRRMTLSAPWSGMSGIRNCGGRLNVQKKRSSVSG